MPCCGYAGILDQDRIFQRAALKVAGGEMIR